MPIGLNDHWKRDTGYGKLLLTATQLHATFALVVALCIDIKSSLVLGRNQTSTQQCRNGLVCIEKTCMELVTFITLNYAMDNH